MSEEKRKGGGPGELLQFPAPQAKASSGEDRRAELLSAVLQPLRSTPTRTATLQAARCGHEEMEAFLREPWVRARVVDCATACLTEVVPQALKGFDEALHRKESWAYKALLDVIGLQRLAEGALSSEGDGPNVVISNAFERDLIENMLDVLRKPSAAVLRGQASDREGDGTR